MKRLVFALAAVLLLSGCGGNYESVSDSGSTAPETDISETTADASVTAEITSADTSESAEIISEPALSYDLSDFQLSDHCGEFAPAKPLQYDVYDGLWAQVIAPEVAETALAALKQSDIFSEVTAKANELFTYENGELIPTGESFLNFGYAEYISFSEAEGITVNPQLAYNIKIGKEGHIFAFAMPLAESLLEWSGTSTCMAAVYVSPDGSACVLPEVSGQTLCDIRILRFVDGSFYAVFQRGHTDGTARAFVVGFADGKPHIEYSGSVLKSESSGTVLSEAGYNITMLLVKTAERGWCYVGSVPMSEECAEILFSDDEAISVCPDIREQYKQGNVHIFGGKYIAVGDGFNDVYEFENGRLIHSNIDNLFGTNGMDESLEFLNILIN